MQVAPTKVPGWMQPPARLVMQFVIGRVRVPGPIAATTTARSARRSTATPTPLPGAHRSASCPARAPTTTSGSTSNPTTTRSTPTPKFAVAARCWVVYVVRYQRMFDRDGAGPEKQADLGRVINLATGVVEQANATTVRRSSPGSTRPCSVAGIASATAWASTAASSTQGERTRIVVQARLRELDPARSPHSTPSC